MRLKGKNVLITGVCGQLGTSIALSFAAEGAKLWLTDTSPERLSNTVDQLPVDSVLGSLVMDVTSTESIDRAFRQVKAHGILDVLVNNAGIGVFTPFWERDYSDFMRVMSVNAGGTFLCTRAALRLMGERGKGCIINIGSIYGVVSSDPRIYTDCERMNSEVYSASKAAVIQMTKYFAVHAAPMGVRVNCVSPGGIFNHQGEAFIENYKRRTPMNRMAQGSDICGALIFLAADEAEYVSGQNILVDGGFTSW